MPTRRRAREIVVQLLFQDELNGSRSLDDDYDFIRRRLTQHEGLFDFAKSLLSGVRSTKTEIDERLTAIAQNWKLTRMAPTDLSTLRLGCYELMHTSSPPQAIINESIEIAKRYGNENSGRFVNGILDKVYQTMQSKDPMKIDAASVAPESTDNSRTNSKD